MRLLIFPRYTRSIGYGCIVEIERPIDCGGVCQFAGVLDGSARERAFRGARERPGSMLRCHGPAEARLCLRPTRKRVPLHQAWPFNLKNHRSRSSREGLFGSIRLDEAEQL